MTPNDTFEALKYRIVITDIGNKYYYDSEDRLHREEGPAIIVNCEGQEIWEGHTSDFGDMHYDPKGEYFFIHGQHISRFAFYTRMNERNVKKQL